MLEGDTGAGFVVGMLFAQGHQGGGFGEAGLADVVFQQAACVAHGVAANALGAMHVAEGYVVEGVEGGGIYVVDAAQADLVIGALGA